MYGTLTDMPCTYTITISGFKLFKDVPGGFPKSDLLGVTVALIHVAAQQFLAVLQRQLALWL